MVSVVIPAYNEAESLGGVVDRVRRTLDPIDPLWEALVIDDGSSDATGELVASLHAQDSRVGLVKLSRNFGKEAAMLAGYDLARGRCVVVLDADGQTPPELIAEMVARWRAGADIVDGVRVSTESISPVRRALSAAFYWIFRTLSSTNIEPNVVDFRLLDARVVAQLRRLRETHRFNRGLIAWLGFRRERVEFTAAERTSGTSRFGLFSLLLYAFTAVLGFSTAPLRLVGFLGLLTSILSGIYVVVLCLYRVIIGQPFPGYATVVGGIFMLGGLQLLATWVLGEYLGRLYDQSKGRPVYVVASHVPTRAGISDPESAIVPLRVEVIGASLGAAAEREA